MNDNFGEWKSNAGKLLEYCLRADAPGRQFVEQLRPGVDDYFVLKPMHSAFYQSPLDIVLRHLGSTSLILCGLATDSCIICTAHDANMRDFRIFVPSDCSAVRSRRQHQRAIQHIDSLSNADVSPSSKLSLRGKK